MLRVLMVHRGVLAREAEAAEVEQLVVGMLQAARSGARQGVDVSVSDGRWVWRAVLHGDDLEYVRSGRLRALARTFDVAHVHMPVPAAHVLAAALLRRHGVPVALSPMGMLGDDYARSTWFRRSPFALVKPAVVVLVRALWRLLATGFVCLSLDEARLAHLPLPRSAAVPWPLPATPLGRAGSAGPSEGGATGPVAFVCRFDVHRKGIDRLCAWLRAYDAELPRPAAVLLTPRVDPHPPELDALVAEGLLEWDSVTTGAALAARLRDCRAAMLLSRFEAQPRALREAAALGLPVITTATGSFRDVVAVLGRGAVVDGDDPASVQAAFHAVAGHDRDPGAGSAVFDPRAVGAFLTDRLATLARGERLGAADYYPTARSTALAAAPPEEALL